MTAVISGVKAVRMDAVGRDMGVLAQCDGKGKCDCIKLGRCRFLEFSNGPGQHVNTEYGNQMEEWALKVGWQKNMMVIIAI